MQQPSATMPMIGSSDYNDINILFSMSFAILIRFAGFFPDLLTSAALLFSTFSSMSHNAMHSTADDQERQSGQQALTITSDNSDINSVGWRTANQCT